MEREGRGRQRERVALGVPLWLDSHLVAMCDRSSRANDGLPEASSIRPGLTGLPERERQKERCLSTCWFTVSVCVCVCEGVSLFHIQSSPACDVGLLLCFRAFVCM